MANLITKKWNNEFKQAKKKIEQNEQNTNQQLIATEIDSIKEKIINALDEKSSFSVIKKYFKILVKKRAEQAALKIKEQEQNSEINEEFTRKEIKAYVQDCTELATAIDTILDNK